MAPNTKQLNLVVKQLSAADLGVTKPVFPPLTQESPSHEACVDVSNYWDWSHEPDESDNYWDWSSNPKEDIVSSTHIISNLEKFQCQKSEVVCSGVDSNDYWDDRTPKDREPVTAQHANEEAADAYWEWSPVYEHADAILERPSDNKISKMIAMILDDERARQMLSSQRIVDNLKRSGSHTYWHEPATTSHIDSSHYWNPYVAPVHTA
ncbi:hypothetical protein MHU86_18232 [Fragilaria crotonensis]|nr:hypothetical protein MHU86_18232 [Fragilaria crotonensis]